MIELCGTGTELCVRGTCGVFLFEAEKNLEFNRSKPRKQRV